MIFLIVEIVCSGACGCVRVLMGNGLWKEEGWPFVGEGEEEEARERENGAKD
jgi:hypothetical protein